MIAKSWTFHSVFLFKSPGAPSTIKATIDNKSIDVPLDALEPLDGTGTLWEDGPNGKALRAAFSKMALATGSHMQLINSIGIKAGGEDWFALKVSHVPGSYLVLNDGANSLMTTPSNVLLEEDTSQPVRDMAVGFAVGLAIGKLA